ncbi:MAG: hydrogenase maturation protease [Anaerolineae bacterium]|jgi:hydrogenase maturation protease
MEGGGASGAGNGCPRAEDGRDSSLVARRPTLIIGVGNPLRGDDAVGVRVVESLSALALPEGVEVVDGGTMGLGLVNLMKDRRRVVLVDAASLGRAPGEFVCLPLAQARLRGADDHLSVHGAGVCDALLLAQALDCLPDEVLIVGVQPASMQWNAGLTPDVQAAVPAITQTILDRLELLD